MKSIAKTVGIETTSKHVLNGTANHVTKCNGSIGQYPTSNGIGHHVRFIDNNHKQHSFEDCNGFIQTTVSNNNDIKSTPRPNGVLKHSTEEIDNQFRAAEAGLTGTGHRNLPAITELSHENSFASDIQRDVTPIDDASTAERIEQNIAENTGDRCSPIPGTSKGTLFRDTVRRHFVQKDKFFNLVQTFLSSIQEEKRAHLDLIDSFSTARQIKVDVHKRTSSAPKRYKHRRKQAEVPLALKIQQAREVQNKSIPDDQPDLSHAHIVKESEKKEKENVDRNTETENSDEVNNNETDKDVVEQDVPEVTAGPSLVKLFPKSYKNSKECVVTVTADVEVSRDSDDDQEPHRLINKASESEHGEEKSESVEVTQSTSKTDEVESERDEVDKLVLESVLSSNADTSTDTISDYIHKTYKGPVIVVEVDSDSESEYCYRKPAETEQIDSENHCTHYNIYEGYIGECVIDLRGTHEDMSSSEDEAVCGRVEVEDLGDDGSDNEDNDIHTLNVKMANISTIEYEKKPKRRMRPQLDPISEAESSRTSFNTILNQSNESSDRPEVQCSVESDNNDHIENEDIVHKDHIDSQRVLMEANHENRKNHYDNHTNNSESSPKHNIDNKESENKSMKGTGAKIKSKNSQNTISLDLIGVYSENKDLQRIDKREVALRTPRKQSNKKVQRAKSGKGVRHKRSMKESVSLPLKQSRRTKSPRAVSCTSTRSAPELHRRTEKVDFYRSFQSQRETDRYKKPDNILWNRIDLSERCVSAVGKYGDQSRDWRDDDDSDRTSSRVLVHREQDEPNTLRTWDMPLSEALKRVKSARNLPAAPDLNETTPRHIRVQQVYSHLKKMRRGNGYTTLKPLISLTRRPNDFRF